MADPKPSLPPVSILKISRIAMACFQVLALTGSVKHHISLAEECSHPRRASGVIDCSRFHRNLTETRTEGKGKKGAIFIFSTLLLPAAGRGPVKPAFLQWFYQQSLDCHRHTNVPSSAQALPLVPRPCDLHGLQVSVSMCV